MEEAAGRKTEKDRRELLGVVNMFPDLIVLMVSQSTNMPKLSKLCILNMCSKLYVNLDLCKAVKKCNYSLDRECLAWNMQNKK